MPKPYNVVVICNDTLRADVVDHTWDDHVNMPVLDKFRAEATSFTRAYGDAYPTVPSRRGFYTGRRAFPWQHNIDDKGSWPNLLGWHAIPSEYETIAETACRNGAMTGLVADLYHMFKPTMNFTRGFVSYDFVRGQESDRTRSGPLKNIDLKPYMHPKETDFARHNGLRQYLLNIQDRHTEEDYFCPKVFRSASRWIDDNVDQEPFMLWIDSFTPHEHWDPPKEFADAYFKKDGVVDYIYPQFFQDKFPFNEDEIARTKALYYGYCTFMDKWIGHLFQKLTDHGLWDNTVVVVTSDHGTELRDLDRFGKCHRANDFNTRLNMHIRHPDKRYHGQTSDALVQNVDLAPSICEWMGIKSEEPYDGKSLQPLLDDPSNSVRECAIGAWTHHAFVVKGDYKLMIDTYEPDKSTALYHLKNDPKERENLANAKPDVVNDLRNELEKLLGAPLPAQYAHEAKPGRSPGLPNFVEHWKDSNLSS